MQLNFIAVLLAALSAFFLGFFWYTIIFAKQWQQLIGLGSKDKDTISTNDTPDLGRLLVGSFILEVCMALFMAAFISNEATWLTGLRIGLTVGFGFVGLAFGVNYMYEGKSLKLWLINAGYNTVLFAIMGMIIGAL